MIAILRGLADVERDLIRTRAAEGPSRAKARGHSMGHSPLLTQQLQAEARRRQAESATLAEVAKSYNVEWATIPTKQPTKFGLSSPERFSSWVARPDFPHNKLTRN